MENKLNKPSEELTGIYPSCMNPDGRDINDKSIAELDIEQELADIEDAEIRKLKIRESDEVGRVSESRVAWSFINPDNGNHLG